jgi:hypothetical protein
MRIRIVKFPGILIGATWHEAGSVVEIPDDNARRLVHDGAAERAPEDVTFILEETDEHAVSTYAAVRERAAKRLGKP